MSRCRIVQAPKFRSRCTSCTAVSKWVELLDPNDVRLEESEDELIDVVCDAQGQFQYQEQKVGGGHQEEQNVVDDSGQNQTEAPALVVRKILSGPDYKDGKSTYTVEWSDGDAQSGIKWSWLYRNYKPILKEYETNVRKIRRLSYGYSTSDSSSDSSD